MRKKITRASIPLKIVVTENLESPMAREENHFQNQKVFTYMADNNSKNLRISRGKEEEGSEKEA